MLKVSENPPIRPEQFASVRDMAGPWWVCHTKSRNEKAFAWDMLNLGIAYFLPMVRKVTVSGGRKRIGLAALFPGYVFLNGTPEQRHQAMRTDRLCAAHPIPQTARFIDEIAALEQTIQSGVPIDIYRFAVAGAKVRVHAGPLTGVVGRIVRREGVVRLVVEISILAQAAFVQIDADLVTLVLD